MLSSTGSSAEVRIAMLVNWLAGSSAEVEHPQFIVDSVMVFIYHQRDTGTSFLRLRLKLVVVEEIGREDL